MGEEVKVSEAETALEFTPVTVAAAAEKKKIPAVEEKKEAHHQTGDTAAIQNSVGAPVSEMETTREKHVHRDQKDAAASNTSSPPISQTENEAVIAENTTEKTPLNPFNRDAVLARVEAEKRNALICAWEENEKAKIDNKTYKRLSATASWENTKKAAIEAQIKQFEEQLQKKRAEYAERTKNKLAEIHKEAEENRALIEATKGQEYVTIEETANTYRATGYTPKKFFCCLGC